MNDYPMLKRLECCFSVQEERPPRQPLAFCFSPAFDAEWAYLTPAEVLALADELRRMAQTQEPAHEVSTKDQYEDPITSTTPGRAVQVVPIPKEPAP